ncbi:hypothetical protein CJP74_06380 [Psittacicella melopsittaci]|uniref:Uncharacterized protein n=1 Tax=Psittacicella melopsittaci TaxID=2028576 RepID=A0A3A1Y0M1_9GAMM|nr:hypothetical protein [Psittacicella melopsittaci]RIY31793.1 hypothetical protein CJP74_06380 [Psittacicella melopsittaci]
MSEYETRSKRRKKRKNNLPDPISLAENYLEVLVARLSIRKKDRIEILKKYKSQTQAENTFELEKIDGLASKDLEKWYEPSTIIVDSDGAVRSVYYDRIKQLKVFTYNINTKVNYLTHDPDTPLRRYYEREHLNK